MKYLSSFLITILMLPVFQTDTNDELVFFPLEFGNAAFMKVDEQLYLFNTGHEKDRQSLIDQLEHWKDYELDTIIITHSNVHNCGNLKYISENYAVNRVILPGQPNQLCQVDETDIRISDLTNRSTIELDDTYQIHYEPSNNKESNGNITLIKDNFSAYWFENPSVSIQNDKKTLVYIPSYIYEEDLTKGFWDQLDPRVAVIQEKAETKEMRMINEFFSKEWIETFFLKKNLSVHVELGDQPYRIFLVKR